jgi:perosamine synthetase
MIGTQKISIYQPYLSKYKNSAIDAINSEWISNHGKYVGLATNKLKEIININNVVLMSNGTVATHCLFISLKYKYPNITKIYLPNNVYIAVYNCALMEYTEDKLEIMKINKDTWNIDTDEEYLLSLEQNSAILICHNLGGIIDVEKIKKIRPDIILLEDNCEGIFGKYNNISSGTSINTLCSSMSFYGNKTITSGEGGAFCTNDEELYKYISQVYSQGMSSTRYIHNVHAYNYRMTNVEAALLYDQLNDIEHILTLKGNVFNNYNNLLKSLIDNNKVKLQTVNNDCKRANWMYAIQIIDNEVSIDDTFNFFLNNNVETRPFFYPYNSHEHLKNIKYNDELDISNKLTQEILMIPSYPTLSLEEQEYIISVLEKFIK